MTIEDLEKKKEGYHRQIEKSIQSIAETDNYHEVQRTYYFICDLNKEIKRIDDIICVMYNYINPPKI
jgi:hypothetical protein